MLRPGPVRHPWRAAFIVALSCALVPAGAAGFAAQQQSARRPQNQQEQRDPDERAAGGERLGNENDQEAAAALLLTPSRQQVEVGALLRLTLSVIGAEDVRRLPATVRFDPTVLELLDVRAGAAWKDGPRPLLLFDAARPGELVIGLALLDPEQPGVSGAAELLELEFRAIGRGNAGLHLERFAALGSHSRAQAMRAPATEIVVR